jgi:hypothetical protein
MLIKRVRRYVGYLLVISLIMCLMSTGLVALSNRSLPTASASPDRLSEADKARLAETLHLRQTVGDAVWPGWGAAEIPTILFNEAYAFLIGYSDPPAGWIKVPGATRRGGAWQLVPDDTFAGAPYYRQALPLPDVTPEAFTVQVGDRWVASMPAYEWTKIKLVSELRADIPAPLRPIVPYRLLVGMFNTDWHIVAIGHEAFHAYQGQVAPDRLLAAETANQRQSGDYPWDDAGFRAAWQTELQLLHEAMQAGTAAEAAQRAGQFLELREARRTDHGLSTALVDFERQREWLEGLAKYAELELWRRAASTPGYEPTIAMADNLDFNDYAGFTQRWSSELVTMQNQAGREGDGRFYYSGWAQAVLLDRLLPGWQVQALDEGVWLEDLLQAGTGR